MRVHDWMERLDRWAAKAEAWGQRQGDRYERLLEHWPWASRRHYVTFLRRSAGEIEHILPEAAARDRRTADKLEREGLEIAFRIDQDQEKSR